MYLLAIFLLLFLATISTVGVFNKIFEDNFLQRCGMVILSAGALSMAHRVWITEWLSHSDITFLVGSVLYSLGTWSKTYYYYKKAHQHE